ncbi:MAG: hypothetical protein IKH45_04605 [Neisseriaceae bacterium]|nr:hypothetical protein [Neisseriaceae bacterium]
MIIILERSIDENQIDEDGNILFTKAEILREKQIRLWVNSKESSCHNIPHIHASCDEKEYSIAIDGTNKLLAPNIEDKYYRCIVKMFLNNTSVIQKCRNYWNNKTDSKLKFDTIYLDSYRMH